MSRSELHWAAAALISVFIAGFTLGLSLHLSRTYGAVLYGVQDASMRRTVT